MEIKKDEEIINLSVPCLKDGEVLFSLNVKYVVNGNQLVGIKSTTFGDFSSEKCTTR